MKLKNQLIKLSLFRQIASSKIKSKPWYVILVLPLLVHTSATIVSIEKIIQHSQKPKQLLETQSEVVTSIIDSPKPQQFHYQLRINYLIHLLPITLASIATSIWMVYALSGKKNVQSNQDLVSFDTSKARVQGEKKDSLGLGNTNRQEEPTPIPEQIQSSYAWLAAMGHELRSPLNAVLGFVQIMKQEISMTPSQKDNLTIIDRSGKQLLATINDLVDLAKIQTHRLSLEKNNFDFYSWLNSIEQNLQFQVYEGGRKFTLIRETNLPQYICTDERRLRQILNNLISCCWQSTSAQELTLRVGCRDITCPEAKAITTTKAQSPFKHHLYFALENNYCWLTAEEIQTLFDPLERVCQEPKLAQSSSLSLPISRQLARLMGGDIIVKHKTNNRQGISFCLNIQTEKIVAEHLQSHSTTQRIIGLEPNQPEYRILIVDDSKINRQIMLQLLEPVGFQVKEAVNGKEAVEVWLDWQPHMIWMDLRMPIMNGYEATEQIKSNSHHKKIPIVAVSASTIEVERPLFQAAGCDDFVGKPFSDKIIYDKIAQHLGIRYVYESSKLAIVDNLSITTKIVNIMPEPWLHRVEQAAARLDRDLLTQLLQQIPSENDELKNILQRQVDNFDFDRILTLVSQRKPQE